MYPKLTSLFTSTIIPGLLFLLANIVIAALNLFVPEYLNKPVLAIANYSLIVDEDEFTNTSSDRALIRKQYSLSGHPVSRCFVLWLDGRIPASCIQELKGIIGDLVEDAKDSNYKINEISSFVKTLRDRRRKAEIDEAISNAPESVKQNLLPYVTFLKFQIDMIDVAAKDDYKDSAKEAIFGIWSTSILNNFGDQLKNLDVLL